MSFFCQIKLILAIVTIISGLVFLLSLIRREDDLQTIFNSRHKVCQLHRIDGAFHLINGTTYIFSGGFFWILSDQFNIQDKTPKRMASFWPQFSGQLLHAFNYDNNAYMIVDNWDQLNTSRRNEVFVVKYNPLRMEKVAKSVEVSKIPHITCFDTISGTEICFYVPQLKSNSDTIMLTTIKNDCPHENFCAAVSFSGPNLLDAPTLRLREKWFSFGESYLPIQFDSYLSYQNDIITIFLDHYYCVKRVSCPAFCRWRSYTNLFCQLPKDFDTIFPVIRISFCTSAAIFIILCYRAFVRQ